MMSFFVYLVADCTGGTLTVPATTRSENWNGVQLLNVMMKDKKGYSLEVKEKVGRAIL